MSSARRFLSLSIIFVVCVAPASGQSDTGPSGLVSIEGLGSLSFPNSGNDAAQEPFVRGVLLLHSFEYQSAAEAFREAQAADPDFALAYWGEAMTYNHPLWRQRDEERGREVLERLAPTAEERRDRAATEREAMFIDAVEALYGAEGSKQDQDRAYMEAMRLLQEAYPDDPEARSFYALSILGTADGLRDFWTYMRAAAAAQPVFEANPEHPGAAHYIIHSFDDPIHAPLGLEAARAYADIAPRAAHAQHMTTHIFLALGMWPEVVTGNIRASDVQNAERAERGQLPVVCGHYPSWLHYGYLMLGETDEAETLMDACHERTSGEPTRGEWSYFVSMRARHIVDTEDWDLRHRWKAQPPDRSVRDDGPDMSRDGFFYYLTNALAALREGDPAPARAFIEQYPDPQTPSEALQIEQVLGLLAIHEGRTDEGIELLRSAAEREDELPMPFGPPTLVKPSFELLGEELLRAGSGDEAEAAYRRAAKRTPGRPLAAID